MKLICYQKKRGRWCGAQARYWVWQDAARGPRAYLCKRHAAKYIKRNAVVTVRNRLTDCNDPLPYYIRHVWWDDTTKQVRLGGGA